MGRKRGEPKETVTIRLTPDCRIRISELKKWRQNQSFNSLSYRKYTNSLIIEQAVNQYYEVITREIKTDGARCGRCDKKRD